MCFHRYSKQSLRMQTDSILYTMALALYLFYVKYFQHTQSTRSFIKLWFVYKENKHLHLRFEQPSRCPFYQEKRHSCLAVDCFYCIFILINFFLNALDYIITSAHCHKIQRCLIATDQTFHRRLKNVTKYNVWPLEGNICQNIFGISRHQYSKYRTCTKHFLKKIQLYFITVEAEHWDDTSWMLNAFFSL